MILTGKLQKLKGALNSDHLVEYTLCIGEEVYPLNVLLGKSLRFEFTGNIFCAHCGKKTKKSYQQGYCYLCATTLARCDICIVRPEKCHFHLQTCREPKWGEAHCMIPHIIYLANTSNLKVGITRKTEVKTRWIDQGATQAYALGVVSSRYLAGLIEVQMAKTIQDKTNWRAMLTGENERLNLEEKGKEVLASLQEDINALQQKLLETKAIQTTQNTTIEWLQESMQILRYPILEYPKKVQSISVLKENNFTSILQGIKGQYLILEKGVMNIRNLVGYELTLTV